MKVKMIGWVLLLIGIVGIVWTSYATIDYILTTALPSEGIWAVPLGDFFRILSHFLLIGVGWWLISRKRRKLA